MRKPRTRRSLIAQLERILASPKVELRLRTIENPSVTSRYSGTWRGRALQHAIVTLDPSAGGLIECAVHEALHLALGPLLEPEFDAELEEVLIKALESHLWLKGFESPTKLRRWRKLLNAKLEAK